MCSCTTNKRLNQLGHNHLNTSTNFESEPVAQLVELSSHKGTVIGSSPIWLIVCPILLVSQEITLSRLKDGCNSHIGYKFKFLSPERFELPIFAHETKVITNLTMVTVHFLW